MVQVGRLEQYSTNIGLSWFVTVTQPKCRTWSASGRKRKVFSEVWWKYDACVCACMCVCVVRCFWHYHAKSQLHKLWSWNFLCKLGAWNRNVS